MNKTDFKKIIGTAKELVSRYKAFYFHIDNIDNLEEYYLYIFHKIKDKGNCILCKTENEIRKSKTINITKGCTYCIYNINNIVPFQADKCITKYTKSYIEIYKPSQNFDKTKIKSAILERIEILEKLIKEAR